MKILIGAAAVIGILITLANLIGGAMWNLADEMPIWWEDDRDA